LVQELQVSDDILHTPEAEEFDKAMESLEDHLEEPHQAELPSLTDFSLDDDDFSFDPLAQDTEPNASEEGSTEQIDENIALAFVTSVLEQLMDSAENRPKAKAYLKSILEAPDILNQLENSSFDGFKEFSGFITHALSSGSSVSELEQSKAEILTVLQNELANDTALSEISETKNTSEESIDLSVSPDQDQANETEQEITTQALPYASIDETLSLNDLFLEHAEPEPSEQAPITEEPGLVLPENEIPEITLEDSFHSDALEQGSIDELSQGIIAGDMPGEEDLIKPTDDPEPAQDIHEPEASTDQDGSENMLEGLDIPDEFIVAEEQNDSEASANAPDNESDFIDFLNLDKDDQTLDDSDTLLEPESDTASSEEPSDTENTKESSPENINEAFFNEDMTLLSDHDYFENMPQNLESTPQEPETPEDISDKEQGKDSENSIISASYELVESDDLGLDQDLELPELHGLEDTQSLLEPADLTEPDENEETQSEEPTVKNSTENNELIETEISLDEDELFNFDTDLILDDTQSLTDEQPSNASDNFSFEDSLENFDQHDELDLSLSDTIYNPEEGGSSESTSQDTEETLKIPQDSLSEEDQLQDDTFSNEQAQESTQIKETQDLNTSEQNLSLLDDSDLDSFSESLENLSLEDETTDTLDDSEHENITQTQTDHLPELDNDILNDDNLILDEGFELEEKPIEKPESNQSDKPSFEPDDIQQVFLEEAHEYIEKLNADLLALDKQADTLQPELVNQVLRGSHTIKGSAAMVQLTNISELAHKMEDSLQVVRDKDLPIPRVLIDVLFQSADAILNMLQNFRQTGSDKSGDHSKLIQTLVFYSEQLQNQGRITQIDVPSSEVDSQEQTDFEPNEIQQVFLEEAKEYVEKLNADLLELDKNANTPQPELINQVLRGSHTIKGSAAMVQLSQLSDLAHKMEDSLQIVRDKNLKVPSLLIDVLFKSVDAISEMLQNFRRTGKDHYETQKLLVETLKFYQKQLEEKADITEAYTAQVETAKAEEPAKGQKPVQPSVAEQTVRIDIAALNNLVNLSAELVIARNRLNNELGAVEKLATKFLKERQSLSQISKKIGESVKKTPRKKDNQEETNGAENTEKAIIESQELEERSDVLEEFSEGEFDRFSEFDIISRDIKSSMLNFEDSIKELRDFSSFLNQNIVKVSTIANDLNRVIVDMRMVPVKQMFIRFSRSVRDIAKTQNKKINFTTEGEDTKLDKMVMEEVIEPMMHIVRNSIGHGIESPENRLESGKPEEGQVSLKAYQKGNRVILEVDDDGAGISVEKVKKKALEKHLITEEEAEQMTPEEATSIIFKPGFSTAEKVTSLHGRGVGLDVVHNTIRKLKGFVNIDSKEGMGTKFIISLPLTLAISDALLVEAEGYTYAIPLDMVFETVNFPSEYIEHEDDKRFIEIRGERFELVYLNDLLGYESDVLHFKATLPVAVIELEDKKVAVGVEKLFGKEEIVVKALGSHLRNVRGVIGATIRGDGQVILILDMNFLLSPEEQKGKDLYVTIEKSETEEIDESAPKLPERTKRKRKSEKICVLAADDSPSVRKYIQSVLHQHDIDVISVDDGLNALNKLPTSNCDIIVTDLEMPRMNGFELVSEVRKMPQYNEVPIVIVTARAGDKHRRKGIELGANAFINKPFDPTQLVETIESFVS
jgi:chemotaxis protein histidine kinase CheA